MTVGLHTCTLDCTKYKVLMIFGLLFSYFKMTRDKAVISEQFGVFRTNCMDCLDRYIMINVSIKLKDFNCGLVL